jgi:hypothetical protein
LCFVSSAKLWLCAVPHKISNNDAFFRFSWHPKLTIPFDTGIVDMSNVVLANGRNFILDKYPCYLCGQRGGLKVKCSSDGCCLSNGDSKQHTVMHVTCARQAGFEVVVDDSKDTILFHSKSLFLYFLQHLITNAFFLDFSKPFATDMEGTNIIFAQRWKTW